MIHSVRVIARIIEMLMSKVQGEFIFDTYSCNLYTLLVLHQCSLFLQFNFNSNQNWSNLSLELVPPYSWNWATHKCASQHRRKVLKKVRNIINHELHDNRMGGSGAEIILLQLLAFVY